jgi:hypothetical protein
LANEGSSKLFKLKTWLSLSETAHHLTGLCGEQVTELDVLRLGLDGHLMLSIYIMSNTWGRYGYLYSEELEKCSSPIVSGGWDIIHGSKPEDRIDYIKLADDTKLINGLYDLPAIFQNKQGIVKKCSELLTNLPFNFEAVGGIVLRIDDNTICQLQECMNSDNPTEDFFFSPAEELPEDSYIVVRTESLRALEQLLFDNDESGANIDRSKATNNPSPTVKRANSYNDCIAKVIAEFTEINGYSPTTVEEVINRMKQKPPLGTIVEFCGDNVSIDGSTPKAISNLSRSIKRLLEQQKGKF